MGTQLDFSVGLGKETTYGTAVPPTRFYESEAKFKLDIGKAQGSGLRPGKGVNRLNRNSLAHIEASGEVALEANTKGLGFLLAAVLGSVTNTAVTPATTPPTFQQVHTLSKTDPMPSYTIQEILPFLGGGADNAHTFTGCMANQIDFEAKEGAIVTIKIAFLSRDMRTDVAAAAASYPAGDDLFTFVHGAIGLAGTLTAPTLTARASLSGAPAANIADFSASISNNLDTGGFNLGGAGKRSRVNLLGLRGITGKITAEYTDNTLRDAYLAQTPLPLVLTFTNGVAELQLIFPAILLKGEVPTSNGGAPITQSIDWEAFDNGVATEPVYVVYRTTDTTP